MTTLIKLTRKNVIYMVAWLILATTTACHAQQSTPVLAHDSSKPYQVWVLCIDRSKSPDKDEFRRLQLLLEDTVDREVDYNDLVWLVEIGSVLPPTAAYQMPALTSNRRELRILAKDQMTKTKAELKQAIENMSQVTATTNLGASLDAARALLVNDKRATSRRLVIGTDFISDLGRGMVSIDPPATVLKHYTRGVNVNLIVTYPKWEYLRLVSSTPAELLEHVTRTWKPYFRDDGATSVAVTWVDAFPVTPRPRS
jgi:hypothetical protein